MEKRTEISILCTSLLLLGALTLVQLSGCGGSGGGTSTGTVTTALTDARSFGSFSSVHVKVVKVVAVRSGQENLTDTDPNLPVMATPNGGSGIDVNLMDFHFVPQILGTATLPAGTYTQIRLILAANQQPNLANYVVRSGDPTKVPLTTPSAQQTGLKINGTFTVTAGSSCTLLIDFNPAAAIVNAGNSGQVILKPTGVKLVQIFGSLSNAGAVVGTIRSPAFSKWSSATVTVVPRNPISFTVVNSMTVFSNLSSADSGIWKGSFSAFLPPNGSSAMPSAQYKVFVQGYGGGAAANGAFKLYSSPAFTIATGVDTTLPPDGNAFLTP